jgi:NADPH:quinone reductase-like Zn-dependent oxidoreductase
MIFSFYTAHTYATTSAGFQLNLRLCGAMVNKVVVVTGSPGGIGSAISQCQAVEGAQVVIVFGSSTSRAQSV